MKKKLFGLLTAILTLGSIVGTTYTVSNKDIQKEDAAIAANMGGGEVLYLKPGTNWKKDGARFAVYFFNNSTNKNAWASMTPCPRDAGYYKVSAPTGTWANLIFCRMNPNATANNWNNKWNQTADLTYSSDKNLFTVANGSWNGATTTWSKWSETPENTTYTVTLNYNDGTTDKKTITETAGTPVVLLNEQLNGDKVFKGWAESAKGEVKYNNGAELANLNAGDNKTFYGIWEDFDTSKHFRVYLNRNGNYDNGYIWTFHYWNDSINNEVAPAQYVEVNSSMWYAYYNISKEAINDCSLQFKCYEAEKNAFVASTDHQSTKDGAVGAYKSGDNAEVYFINSITGGYYLSKGAVSGTEKTITNDKLYLTLLDGYDSCSSDKDSGYGNASTLFNTWFNNHYDDKDHWLNDGFDYGDIVLSDTDKEGNKYSAWNKIEFMMISAEKNSSATLSIGNLFGENNEFIIILLITLVASFGVMFIFVKKRKQHN